MKRIRRWLCEWRGHRWNCHGIGPRIVDETTGRAYRVITSTHCRRCQDSGPEVRTVEVTPEWTAFQ